MINNKYIHTGTKPSRNVLFSFKRKNKISRLIFTGVTKGAWNISSSKPMVKVGLGIDSSPSVCCEASFVTVFICDQRVNQVICVVVASSNPAFVFLLFFSSPGAVWTDYVNKPKHKVTDSWKFRKAGWNLNVFFFFCVNNTKLQNVYFPLPSCAQHPLFEVRRSPSSNHLQIPETLGFI